MDNNNRGAIFKNKYKESDKHPDYKGTCTVDGIQKEMSCWINEDKNGQKYFSVVFSDPFVKKEEFSVQKPDLDSGLPF